jgi:Tfp pilus assembly protein PilO
MRRAATVRSDSKEESNDRAEAAMKSRTIVIGAVGAVLVIVVWWMFVFSGIRSDASDVNGEIDDARAETRALETQLAQIEDLEANSAETQQRLQELEAAVPEGTELGTFIDQANALGLETGVTWVSVTPAPPTAGVVGTVNLSIVVSGGYYNVLDYLNRMENMPRLVVVDGVQIDQGEAAEITGPPNLTATLTARMFTQAATTAPDGTTTAPQVEGGGGVAATPTGPQES